MDSKAQKNLAIRLSIGLPLIVPTCAFLFGCQKVFENKETFSTRTKIISASPQVTPTAVAKVAAKGEPINVPEGLFGSRTYFQTRTPITLKLSEKVIKPGERFSLLNLTNKNSLIEDESLSTGLRLDGYSTSDLTFGLAAYEVTLTLYPMAAEFAAKFGYGEQKLGVKVDDGAGGRSAEFSITRKDFNWFGLGTSAFDDNISSSAGLEVAPRTVEAAVSTNGVHTLTIGPIDMMSR